MREFQTKERKYFIDFLPNSIFNSFTINERSNYSKYRDRHRKYHKGLNELDELKNKIEELKVQLKLKGNDIKSHEKDLQTYYDGVKHLDKKIDFNAWVETEWRNKKKCLDDNSLKPNWRVSVIVEFKLRGSRIRKRFYCGNWKKTKQTLDKHIGKEEHFISKEEEDIRWILQDYIESFSRWTFELTIMFNPLLTTARVCTKRNVTPINSSDKSAARPKNTIRIEIANVTKKFGVSEFNVVKMKFLN